MFLLLRLDLWQAILRLVPVRASSVTRRLQLRVSSSSQASRHYSNPVLSEHETLLSATAASIARFPSSLSLHKISFQLSSEFTFSITFSDSFSLAPSLLLNHSLSKGISKSLSSNIDVGRIQVVETLSSFPEKLKLSAEKAFSKITSSHLLGLFLLLIGFAQKCFQHLSL